MKISDIFVDFLCLEGGKTLVNLFVTRYEYTSTRTTNEETKPDDLTSTQTPFDDTSTDNDTAYNLLSYW